MIRGSLEQVAAAMDGAQVTRDAYFQGVFTDSRNVVPGALFVALRGETFDAHDFLGQLPGQAVAAVVVERLPEHYPLPAIVVPDTLAALGRIGRFWRDRFAIPVIGVTGSNGKTTVKEMIAAILGAAFGEPARLATQGNLNNEIGVPLTVVRLTDAHRAAVVELGMNHPGEIARLAAIAAPTVALVNNAQREHQEFMHTVEAVARSSIACVCAGLSLSMPARICSMIARGSSLRGLSLVTTTWSAAWAMRPICGRLPGSRSPPQPNTHHSSPPRSRATGRSASSVFSRASGVCA